MGKTRTDRSDSTSIRLLPPVALRIVVIIITPRIFLVIVRAVGGCQSTSDLKTQHLRAFIQ